MIEAVEYTIRLGVELVSFSLRRSDRRTLGLTVFPDGTILVAAPRGASMEEIFDRLHRKGGWLLRTRRFFEAFRPRTPPRRHLNGETHRYLGRQLRLSVRPDAERGVRADGAFLIVGGVDPDPRTIEGALQRWYHQRARVVLRQRLELCSGKYFPEYPEVPELLVRRLTRRWGSMSADGRRIILNVRLTEASRPSIDYVVVHELCHITCPHHGPAFFNLLETRMPDWQRRKQGLEKALA